MPPANWHPLCALISVPDAPLVIQLLGNMQRKAVENNTSTWVPVPTSGPKMKLLVPGFGLAQPWLLCHLVSEQVDLSPHLLSASSFT